MKTALRLSSFVGRFIAQTLLSISFLIGLGLSLSFADTLPLATSTVWAGRYTTSNILTLGPLPGPLGLPWAEVEDGYSGPIYWQKNASAVATTALSGISGSNAYATAQAYIIGPDPNTPLNFLTTDAFATGIVDIYCRVNQIKSPPFTPSTINMDFITSGKAEVAYGYGGFWLSSMIILATPQYEVRYEGGPSYSSLDVNTDVSLQPNTSYTLEMIAHAWAFSDQSVDGYYSLATASIDPIIRFDQAAFDAQYGSNSFNLEEYYQIDFSPNLAPLPYTLLLLGSGLLGLVGWRRFRKG